MTAKDRVWLEVVCGSNDPDVDKKKLVNILQGDPIFHNSEAEQRAVYEFNKAVFAYRDPKLGNSEAARHLGRSIHYVQDLLDISKHWGGNADAKRFRSYSEALAQRYLLETANPGGRPAYPKWLAAAVRQVREEFGEVAGTPAAFMSEALKGRAELSDIFKKVTAGPDHARKLDQFVEKMALATLVVQGAWVSMYLRYIGIAEK
jgi:hypothetical protein